MTVKGGRWDGNEIALTDDFNNNTTNLIENYDYIMEILGDSMVVTGLEASELGTPAMSVQVSEGIAKYSEGFLLTDALSSLAIADADSTSDRIDIIEIRRTTEDITPETRQVKDATTGDVTSTTIYTEVEYQTEIAVVTGVAGSSVAPSVDSGWLKIAEVFVGASVTAIYDENIYNVDADRSGVNNTSWTNDQATVYRNGTVLDMRTAIQENSDNIATNANNITANTDNISTNASDISTNSNDISTNTSNISTNTDNISSNSSAISDNTSNISSNSDAISTLNSEAVKANEENTFTEKQTFEESLIAEKPVIGFPSGVSLVGSSLSVATSDVSITAMSSTRIAMVDDNNFLRAYDWNGSTWSLVGSSLSMSIDLMQISALSSTRIAIVGASTLATYDFNGSTWSQTGNALTISNLDFPYIAALTSTRVAITDNGSTGIDALRAYSFDGSDWSLTGTSLSTGFSASGLCALSTNKIVLFDTSNERIRTYYFDGSTWDLLGNYTTTDSFSAVFAGAISPNSILEYYPINSQLRIYQSYGSVFELGAVLSESVVASSIAALTGTTFAVASSSEDTLSTYKLDFTAGPPAPVFS
ncbi:MAG: hypothetical protein PQJ59_16575 [Spirochaetales bacterium]|nr:hypothetical protein [Spirochaetales bacterium]